MDSRTPITARQPVTALFVLASLCYLLLLRIPFLGLYYLRSKNRPDPQWRWKEAMGASGIRFVCAMVSRARFGRVYPAKSSKPSQPTMPAAAEALLSGVASSSSVKPVDVIGEWYPAPYKNTDSNTGTKVVLFFNGGAYVMGDFQASSYMAALKLLCPPINGKWLSVAYRLAGSAGGQPFPSQLQDAITAYSYVLSLGVPAKNIVLAGESAGGNLAIGFLRYLEEHQQNTKLPLPGATLLFSPWVDLTMDPFSIVENPRYRTCITVPRLLEWGLSALIPPNMKRDDPYLSPVLHPFRSSVPIWIEAASNEVFYDAIKRFADAMSSAGNVTRFSTIDHGTHGSTWTGAMVGFVPTASIASCTKFLQEHLEG